jgi:hypothetical protein
MATRANRVASPAASYVGRPELAQAVIAKSNTVQFGARRLW